MRKKQHPKKFHLFEAVLSVICVVLITEAAAPVAAIGTSQLFWQIFLMIGFLVPFGLITSELGTTYPGEGGLYDWVVRAYGHKWGGRVSWCYWLNFPIWMASLAAMFPKIITMATGVTIDIFGSMVIELAFVWIVTLIAFTPICDSILLLKITAVIKVFLALFIGGLGIYGAMKHGMATNYTLKSLLPTFDLKSLSFISVVIFNFLGFEVICTMIDDMEEPKKQIPGAIILGGLVIAGIYIFSAFGISAAIPVGKISTSSGLIDAVQIMTGHKTSVFILIVSVLFLFTLFGNMVSWSMGVNRMAAYAADRKDMPGLFAQRGKHNIPTGAAGMNGIVASFLIFIAPMIPNKDMFWSFFSLNLILCLLSYIPVFPAFIKLRKIDSKAERPFKVRGNDFLLKVTAYVPMTLLCIALFFLAVPTDLKRETLISTLPVTSGAILAVILGEIVILCMKSKEQKEEVRQKS